MIEQVTQENVGDVPNASFRSYVQTYLDIEASFMDQIASFGLPVADRGDEPDGSRALTKRARALAARGAQVANDNKSFSINWISPACITCRIGTATETFLTSTQCPRDCFFCFNPNQIDYEYYLDHVHDVASELEQRCEQGVRYLDLALTGGEPLLHKDETLAFFRRAQELCPQAYTRLYTSGSYLDEDCLRALREAGLDEIRFSVKTEDAPTALQKTFDRIALSREYIESVVIEMPVMPDDVDRMRRLLKRLDDIGVAGINLLELCFPLNNADEFARRGYKIKARPFRVLYDYWYAGGLPIAGSEEACLALLEFALDERLGLGVHYCSLENKFTGQIYQQNAAFKDAYPCCSMSARDYFLKSAKVFGEDARKVRAFLDACGMATYRVDDQYDYLEFPVAQIALLEAAMPDVPVGVCYYVVESREGDQVLRELRVDRTTPRTFDPAADA